MKPTPSQPRLHPRAARVAITLGLTLAPLSLPPLARAAGTEIFRDDFNTTSFDTTKWSIASWSAAQDRTQWGPNPLTPTVQGGYATLSLNTYNPDNPGVTFKGTEIIAKSASAPFAIGTGMEFETRVRTNTTTPGIISAFYTYGSHGTNNALSDETDFEFASKDNNPSPAAGDMVYLTNWNDWSSGSNTNDTTKHSFTHPNVSGLDVNAWNTLLVRWLPDRTEWYINGSLVRTTTQAVPNDPMNLIFNIWAPDTSWSSAYSSALQPTATASQNVSHTMDLDYAVVRQIPANTWTLSSGTGTWSTAANWNAASAPSAVGAAVNFLNVPSAAATITLDSAKTVGSLTFDSANAYTLTGSSVTLDVSSGSATLAANSGSHTIASPVTLNDNTTANVAAGSTLSITTSLTGPAVTLTKSTGTGTLRLAAFRVGTLTVNAGTVQLIPNSPTASKVGALNVSNAVLDLTDNALTIDYTGSSPATTVRTLLSQGRTAGGTWAGTTGVLSSAAAADSKKITAIGYVEASALLGLTGTATATWDGQTVDATSLLLKYTYYGDANLDGKVDADDYALLDKGFRKRSTGWSNGDFNYDNTVDSNDYLLIDRAFALQSGSLSPGFLSQRESEFGAAYVSELLTSIPEPSTVGCILVAIPFVRRNRGGGRFRARVACGLSGFGEDVGSSGSNPACACGAPGGCS